MGLLTDEKQRHKIIQFIIKYHLKLSILLYVVGFLWFLALAYQPLNASTYFSENALLPGLVESDLPYPFHSLKQYKEEVKAELNRDKSATPQSWIYNRFRELGLDTYRQNFSLIYPFKSLSKKRVTGENVYAILRARRAASTEALVFSVPLRPLGNKLKPATGGGIALALALAKEFRNKPYWAKDIIFLFTGFDEIGPLAWLDAYHQSHSEYIVAEELEGRSGAIQGALNIEIPLEKANYYAVKVEGLNGQLANLDLVNLVVKLAKRERARVSIHQSKDERTPSLYVDAKGESLQEYLLALKNMFRMMWHQASGAPSGNHGLFHRFHIEAVSLVGVKEKGGTKAIDLKASARIVEGIFRSLNNLLERFHQSFFFYILPDTHRYVSIGMYMPPYCMIAAAALVKGIALWVGADEEESDKKKKKGGDSKDKSKDKNSTGEAEDEKKDGSDEKKEGEKESKDNTEKESKDNTEKEKGDKKDKSEEGTKPDDELDQADDMDGTPKNGLFSIIPILLVSALLGWLAYQGPELLSRIMPRFRIHTEDMVLYSILAIFTAAVMYPKLMIRKARTPSKLVFDWRLLKSLALIGESLVLTAISLVNISQAFFLTVAMVPVTVLVQPTNSRIWCWIQMIALVLVSPLNLMFVVGLISSWPKESTLDLIMDAMTQMRELIFLGVMDSFLFSTWTTATITAVIFPIWLLFWSLPWAEK